MSHNTGWCALSQISESHNIEPFGKAIISFMYIYRHPLGRITFLSYSLSYDVNFSDVDENASISTLR